MYPPGFNCKTMGRKMPVWIVLETSVLERHTSFVATVSANDKKFFETLAGVPQWKK